MQYQFSAQSGNIQLHKLTYKTYSSISTGMGNHIRVQLRVRKNNIHLFT